MMAAKKLTAADRRAWRDYEERQQPGGMTDWVKDLPRPSRPEDDFIEMAGEALLAKRPMLGRRLARAWAQLAAIDFEAYKAYLKAAEVA